MSKRNKEYPGFYFRKNAVEKYLKETYPHEFTDGRLYHKVHWLFALMDRYGLTDTNRQRQAIFDYASLLLEMGKITVADLKQSAQSLEATKERKKEKKKWPVQKKRDAKAKRQGKSLPFYASWEWCQLRYAVLQKYGAKCMCCGSIEKIVVDHIKPRSKYPALELEFSNMQVLCDSCNRGKSNTDFTDWRPPECRILN